MQESAPPTSPPSTAPPAFTEGLATPLQFVKGVGPRVARVYVGSAAAGRADEGSRMEGGG